MIHVRRAAEYGSPAFEVVVREGNSETRHHVTMSREICERLTAGKPRVRTGDAALPFAVLIYAKKGYLAHNPSA